MDRSYCDLAKIIQLSLLLSFLLSVALSTSLISRKIQTFSLQLIKIQGGPKVSTHTLGLIPPPCFIFEGCCFADGILYLFV